MCSVENDVVVDQYAGFCMFDLKKIFVKQDNFTFEAKLCNIMLFRGYILNSIYFSYSDCFLSFLSICLCSFASEVN